MAGEALTVGEGDNGSGRARPDRALAAPAARQRHGSAIPSIIIRHREGSPYSPPLAPRHARSPALPRRHPAARVPLRRRRPDRGGERPGRGARRTTAGRPHARRRGRPLRHPLPRRHAPARGRPAVGPGARGRGGGRRPARGHGRGRPDPARPRHRRPHPERRRGGRGPLDLAGHLGPRADARRGRDGGRGAPGDGGGTPGSRRRTGSGRLVRAASDLDRQQRLLDEILGAMPHQVSLWDRDERLVWANERFAAGLGEPREALVGRTWRELWRDDPRDRLDSPKGRCGPSRPARPSRARSRRPARRGRDGWPSPSCRSSATRSS